MRSLWIAVAMFMMICCGPVKRLVELKCAGNISWQTESKKLKTWYRDKRTASATIHFSDHHANDNTDPVVLFIAPLVVLLLSLFSSKEKQLQVLPGTSAGQQIPLYLHYQNLRL